MNEMKTRKLEKTDLIPYDLLLMADPSKVNVDKYIFDSAIYTIDKGGVTIGCYVLHKRDNETIEIRNISVRSDCQGKGIGTYLLTDALDKVRTGGFREVIVRTGNSSIGQLYLYQKVGFRITGIQHDYFRMNYEATIMENGIECRDMIVLTMEL